MKQEAGNNTPIRKQETVQYFVAPPLKKTFF